MIDMNRVARSLAITPRWQGNLIHEYYVTDHLLVGLSVMKARGADKAHRKAWLIHDIGEYLLGDLNTPEKKNLPDYISREKAILNAACQQFDVFPALVFSDEVKDCDYDVACAENVSVHYGDEPSMIKPIDSVLKKVKGVIEADRSWRQRQLDFSNAWWVEFEQHS